MSLYRFEHPVEIDTDENGDYSFTIEMPFGYPYVAHSIVTPDDVTPFSLTESGPPVVTSDGWTGLYTARFTGSTDVISGTVLIQFYVLSSNEPISEFPANYDGSVVQP